MQTEHGVAPAGAVAAVAAAVRAAAVASSSWPPSRAEGSRPASAQASGALSSLDRIVGLWKRACQVKDGQIRELQCKLSEAHDSLAAAEASHDAQSSKCRTAPLLCTAWSSWCWRSACSWRPLSHGSRTWAAGWSRQKQTCRALTGSFRPA